MRIAEALAVGTQELAQRGIERPEIEARLILGDVLRCSSVDLIVNDDLVLTSHLESQWRALLERRLAKEPFAYLSGRKEFYGIDFHVSRHVLIPRPETEQLVEGVLKRIKKSGLDGGLIIDLGTGSGCIAITLAKYLPSTFKVLGVDVSEKALEVARKNAARLNVENVSFERWDLLLEIDQLPRADIWVSNPPYIPTDMMDSLPSTIKAYEPHIALEAGCDGLLFYRKIFSSLEQKMICPKLVALETMGANQIEKIRELIPETAVVTVESPHCYVEMK